MDEKYKLLIQSLGEQLTGDLENSSVVVRALISETVKFRDKLKEETGEILTVADTRAALEALECLMRGEPFPASLSSEQKALAQIYADRLTLFRA